LIDIA